MSLMSPSSYWAGAQTGVLITDECHEPSCDEEIIVPIGAEVCNFWMQSESYIEYKRTQTTPAVVAASVAIDRISNQSYRAMTVG